MSSLVVSNAPMHFGIPGPMRIIKESGKLFFVQAIGDSSSWSGVFMNNGGWCKCTLYK